MRLLGGVVKATEHDSQQAWPLRSSLPVDPWIRTTPTRQLAPLPSQIGIDPYRQRQRIRRAHSGCQPSNGVPTHHVPYFSRHRPETHSLRLSEFTPSGHNSQPTHVTCGSFYLQPRETIEIDNGVSTS